MTPRTRGVLHLTTFLQGGAGRAVMDLALGQQAAGRTVALAASRTAPTGVCHYPEYAGRLRDAGVPFVEADSSFSRDARLNESFAAAVRSAVSLDEFAVIHAHAATPARIGLMLASGLDRRLPVVQTMHGWGTNKTPAQEADDLATLARVARVVVTSRTSGDFLAARGVPRERIVAIPCGIDEQAPGDPPDEAAGPLRRAREAGIPVVVCVGTVNARKNQRLLVEAIDLVGNHRTVAAAFVGEGPDIASLEALARERGIADRVWFLGYQPRGASFLAEADALVLPSIEEGQGLAVVEAFRARVPVVASAIPALRELVCDGETGFTFTPNDVRSLAAVLSKTLQLAPGRRKAIADRAHALFTERYTVGAMIAAHDELYSRVASQQSKARRPLRGRGSCRP